VRFSIQPVVDNEGLAQAHDIRRQVFIIEQDVPESVEMDEFDEAAYHILCRVEGEVVGTGRVHFQQTGGKISWRQCHSMKSWVSSAGARPSRRGG